MEIYVHGTAVIEERCFSIENFHWATVNFFTFFSFRMTSKKKKNKNKDFNKVKIKVGKGKLPAANATDTSFKAKALTLGAQYKHTARGSKL